MGELAKELKRVLGDERKWVRDQGISSLEEILPVIDNRKAFAAELSSTLRPLARSSDSGIRHSAESAITLAKELSKRK